MKHPGFPLLIFSMIYLALSCQNNKPPAEGKSDSVKKNYFPVSDFMKSEISYVDSTPLAILRYDIGDKRRDSGFIKATVFDQLSQEFLSPELDSPFFEQHFSESSFIDDSTKTVSFTYASKDSSSGLQRVDIIASPQANGLNKVKSVYMERTLEKKDTFFVKKLFWKSQESFLVITISRLGNQPPETRQLKVVWGNSEH
jgi:hypothetical protein